MTRLFTIERIRRQIYGGQPTDDASITINLVNTYLNDGIAIAAKQCYKDSLQIEGIGYVNNSFYTTFKGIAVTKDENFVWKLQLPQLPIGIGTNSGIETLCFKDASGNVSYPCVLISSSEASIFRSMRPVQNKVIAKPEGEFCFAYTTIRLSDYTATVTMISGGDSTDLSSTLNVPDDYINIITEYLKAQLGFEKAQKQDTSNDGVDN